MMVTVVAQAAGMMPAGMPSRAEQTMTPMRGRGKMRMTAPQIRAMTMLVMAIHLRGTKRKMTVERKATIMVTTVGSVAMRTETLS